MTNTQYQQLLRIVAEAYIKQQKGGKENVHSTKTTAKTNA